MRPHAAIVVYVACFSIATLNHAADVVRGGWLPYRFAPLPLNMFWTALTLLDPAVVLALLAGWRRVGLSLALAIMIVDVAANSYALYGLDYSGFSVSLQLQTAFLGFVVGTIAFLWPTKEKPGAPG